MARLSLFFKIDIRSSEIYQSHPRALNMNNEQHYQVEMYDLIGNSNAENNRLRDRFVMLEENVISDLESMQNNIETLEDNMKSFKQSILDQLTPIINGLLEENASLRDQVSILNKNMMMFREKLNVSEDEPYNTEYNYDEIKSNKAELHAEFKKIYKFFKKSLVQTYAPVAVVVSIPNK